MQNKKQAFLSTDNTKTLIKTLYQIHASDGGTLPLPTIQEQVPMLQQNWRELVLLDSYESITLDPVEELESINSRFVNTYRNMFEVADGHRIARRKLDSVDDYRTMDTTQAADVPLFNSEFRPRGTTVPAHQRIAPRMYAESSGRDRTRETIDTRSRGGNMDRLLREIDRPYKKIDDLDTVYYGQRPDESNTLLMSTRWRSG